jgi:hypothetical protein
VVAITTAPRIHRRAAMPVSLGGRPQLVLLPGGLATTPPVAPAVYWCRRLVAALIVVGLASALWAGLGALGGALTVSGRSSPLGGAADPVYVVQPGDTLWTLARRLDPGGDPRPLVDRLVAARAGATLQVGERFSLPGALRP